MGKRGALTISHVSSHVSPMQGGEAVSHCGEVASSSYSLWSLFPATCKEPWSSVTKKKLSSPYCFNKAASTHLHQDRSVSSRRWSCSTCTCGQEPQPHSLSSGLCLLLVGRHLNCPDSWAVKRFIACALAGLSLVSVPKSLSGAGLAVLIP